jgi:hypothetical protein
VNRNRKSFEIVSEFETGRWVKKLNKSKNFVNKPKDFVFATTGSLQITSQIER